MNNIKNISGGLFAVGLSIVLPITLTYHMLTTPCKSPNNCTYIIPITKGVVVNRRQIERRTTTDTSLLQSENQHPNINKKSIIDDMIVRGLILI